jgi:hypothetical protein
LPTQPILGLRFVIVEGIEVKGIEVEGIEVEAIIIKDKLK